MKDQLVGLLVVINAVVDHTDKYPHNSHTYRNKKQDFKNDDVLIITADHGCDPGDESTDHTREYVPFIMYGEEIESKNNGTIDGFTFVADTVRKLLLG